MAYCANCGQEIAGDKQVVCLHCGVLCNNGSSSLSGGKSRVAAGIIAIFLGGLGIHKFYMKKPGLGIVYILLCWTFVPSIVGFIEGIIYLCEDDESFAKKIPA